MDQNTLQQKMQEYDDSRSRDFVKVAAANAERLENASLNNDSRLRAKLIKQMQPFQPVRQILDVPCSPGVSLWNAAKLHTGDCSR